MPPNPKTNPKPNPNPNQGTILLGDNCLVAPNPKTNPDLHQNPNFNWGGGGGGVGNFPQGEIVRISFRRRAGYLLNVLCTFNLRPVFTRMILLILKIRMC